jgi:hypothetical protein
MKNGFFFIYQNFREETMMLPLSFPMLLLSRTVKVLRFLVAHTLYCMVSQMLEGKTGPLG